MIEIGFTLRIDFNGCLSVEIGNSINTKAAVVYVRPNNRQLVFVGFLCRLLVVW